MIRLATLMDVDALMPMAERFWNRMEGWCSVVAFSAPHARAGLEAIIEMEAGAIFVIDVDGVVAGAAGFGLGPIWIRSDTSICQEMFWWVEPEGSREALALWRAGEAWAQERGAVAATMIRVEGLRDEALDRTYRRRGYNPVEHHYVRRL